MDRSESRAIARGTSSWEVLAALATAVWAQRGRTAATLALLVAAKVAAVAVPLALKRIVDTFTEAATQTAAPGAVSTIALPVALLVGYALVRFASTLFTELRDVLFVRVTLRIVAGFVQRTFGHLLALNPRFHAGRNTGVLARDVERGTRGIAFLLGAALFTLLPTLIEFAGVLGVLLAAGYSPAFTFVIGATFLVYATYTAAMTRQREARQRVVNEHDSRAHGRLVDGLLNFETVLTYSRQAFERERHAAIQSQWIEASVQSQHTLSALHIGQSAIIAAGVAAVMLLAGHYALQGQMSVGDLVLVNAYLIQLCLPLNTLGNVFRQSLDALVDTERLFALLHRPPDIADRADAKPLALQGGAVTFRHIDFAYETGRPILRDFSLDVPAGQSFAIVGGSGSGKSTLARLLLRLYDPDAGHVSIDGQDLRALQLNSLHDAIGVVAQDTALFNDTIAYNIGYGRPGASPDEIRAAARAAQVHEFIVSLPQQYDTVVGERGVKLSGGEKQRVAIARAILKNPPILIMDEATAALDTRAERAIQDELERIARGRTALIIAHRLSTIVNADRIVVMDRGRIVESGRHDELLERAGLYAQLWRLQLQQREFERLERRLARRPVNLAVLLAGTVDALRAPLDARRIALYTDIDPATASVAGDPGVLAQALHDVAWQAMRATPVGGRIELSLTRHDVHAVVTVTDGRHLASSDARPRATRATDGPPMDPLAVRASIEGQGGRFTVEPDTRSHGMRYVIALPLQAIEVPAVPPGAAPPARHRPRLRGLDVLCVDDDADTLEALTLILRTEGAEVITFQRGRDALGWLDMRPATRWPQLLACDIALGDNDDDGHDVMRRIRRLEADRGVPLAQRLPAVALTGRARPEDRLSALMAGFQMHLVKPVAPDVLADSLAALAGRVNPP